MTPLLAIYSYLLQSVRKFVHFDLLLQKSTMLPGSRRQGLVLLLEVTFTDQSGQSVGEESLLPLLV